MLLDAGECQVSLDCSVFGVQYFSMKLYFLHLINSFSEMRINVH